MRYLRLVSLPLPCHTTPATTTIFIAIPYVWFVTVIACVCGVFVCSFVCVCFVFVFVVVVAAVSAWTECGRMWSRDRVSHRSLSLTRSQSCLLFRASTIYISLSLSLRYLPLSNLIIHV